MRFEYQRSNDRDQTNLPKPYNLQWPVEADYARARHRVLVIVEHVSGGDLRAGRVLGDEITRVTYQNVLSHADRIARQYGCRDQRRYAFFNFNWMKSYDLDKRVQRSIRRLAAQRVDAVIAELNPTLIIVVGDNAASAITGDRDIELKRGLIHQYRGITLVNTVDFDQAYSPPGSDPDEDLDDKAVAYANMLGYVSRNIANGFLGRVAHDLSWVTPRARLVNTLRAFHRLMRRLNRAQHWAADTEGTSLQTSDNRLQFVQFSITANVGYIIPIHHREARWTAEELAEIMATLREFFGRKMPGYHGRRTRFLVGQNWMYDNRILFKALNLRHIYWPVWDLMAGEMSLDENIGILATKTSTQYEDGAGTGHYGLAQMCQDYNNDFYYTNEFSKDDRTRIAEMPLTPAFLRYMSMDTQMLIAIQEQQAQRADRLEHDGGTYRSSQHLLVLSQMSAMVKTMSVMRYRGTQLDVTYLLGLLKPNSEIVRKLDEFTRDFYTQPSVRAADARLRTTNNIPTGSIFDTVSKPRVSQRVFDIGKKDHLKVLFIDELGLEPLRYGKPKPGHREREPSLDKFFLKAYAEENEVVRLYQGLTEIKTLKSMFLDSFYQHMVEGADSRADQRIRAEFGFLLVTGRGNSYKPSMQQIPEHTSNAKLVKRMFITAALSLGYEADFSGHEMRCWGIMSGDKSLVQTFTNIHALILKYRRKYRRRGGPTPEEVTELELKADPHRQNYSFFANILIELVTKVMRQAAKGITFGAMYGKSAKSLARDLGIPLEEALDILERFFKRFARAGDWLKWAVSYSQKNMYVFNFLRRRRNLFGYLSAHPAVVAAMQRRAQNSPIQGLAAEVLFLAAELFSQALHECYEILDITHDAEALAEVFNALTRTSHFPTGPNVTVHDSIKGEAPFLLFRLHLHLLEWSMTRGVTALIEERYGERVNTPFDIDIKVGASWAGMEKWDWSARSLEQIVTAGLTDHKSLYPKDALVQAIDPAEVFAEMQTAYREQRKLLDLDRRYPLNLE